MKCRRRGCKREVPSSVGCRHRQRIYCGGTCRKAAYLERRGPDPRRAFFSRGGDRRSEAFREARKKWIKARPRRVADDPYAATREILADLGRGPREPEPGRVFAVDYGFPSSFQEYGEAPL